MKTYGPWGLRRPFSGPRDDAPPMGGCAATEAGPGTHGRDGSRASTGSIGMFWSPPAPAGSVQPFSGSGRDVAGVEWARALIRYATSDTIDVFTPILGLGQAVIEIEGAAGEAGRQVAQGWAAKGKQARVFPESALRLQLSRCHYDVLHLAQAIDFESLAYARAKFSSRVFPVTCPQFGISYSPDLHPCFVSLLTARLYPCDAIVCSTDASRKAMDLRLADIAQRYSRAWRQCPPPLPRLELIPWGVDTQRFAPRDPQPARRDLRLPPDRPVVLCLGRARIADKMDWTPLLLAFQRVCRRTDARPILILAGSNPSSYGEHLMTQAGELGLGDDVRSFFNCPPACLPSLYAACDVFVSPTDSPTESFGLTIIEAMACGRPVVASDWNGYKESIVEGETGFKIRTDWADCLGEFNTLAPLFPWDREHLQVGQSVSVDVGQMAQAILQLLESPELRGRMGERGRARAEALYGWPTVIAQWEALWHELGRVARALEHERDDLLDYLQPNYFQHFSHYASRIVDDETPVTLTARGRDLLARHAPYFLLPGAVGLLEEETLNASLQAVRTGSWRRRPVALGELLAVVARLRGIGRDRSLMHVMWLAKQDLLAFLARDGESAINHVSARGGSVETPR